MKIIYALTLSILFTCSPSLGRASWLHVNKTIEIDAPADKVWDLVKDFGKINLWVPGIEKVEMIEGTENTKGAVRLLTLKDGGTLKEKLLGYKPQKHWLKFSILEGALPVSYYASSVFVKSIDANKSRATWAGKFKRKNVSDNGAEKDNDKTAVDAVSTYYQSGLDNLKKLAEKK